MNGTSITLGNIEVTRISEFTGPSAATPGFLFPDSAPAMWAENAAWLDPEFYDSSRGTLRTVLHSWLLRSEGVTVLLDTGAGNAKERPNAPAYAHLDTAYLARLEQAGVRADEVDVVVNTHLHVDHVGWNTRLDSGEWVPTFPNARYLMPAADVEYWDPARHPRPPGDGNQNVYEDSVAPVERAGLVQRWETSLEVTGELALEPAPGHTPGSSVLRLRSAGTEALFVGDILHSPIQILAPDVNSCWCEDTAAARGTRHRLLAEAAERNLLVFPGHFGGHSACRVEPDPNHDDAFVISDWADFARI